MNSEPKPPSENEVHYKARSRAWVFAIIFTPIVSLAASVTTAYFTALSTSEKANLEANVEIVNLAVKIIQEPKGNRELAAWAINALRRHSDVPMDEQQFKNMLDETMAVDGLDLNPEAIDVDPVLKGTTGISVKDIKNHGIFGGPNSIFRKPFG